LNISNWSNRLSVLVVLSAFLGLSTLPTDADARRMGGGSSFGRSAPSQFQKTPPAAPTGSTATAQSKQQATGQSATAGNTSAAPRNRFLAPLAGLAAGLGLAALFSHLGLGAGLAEFMGTLLMIAVAVFAVLFLLRILRGQQAAKPSPAFSGAGSAPIHDPVPGMAKPQTDLGFGQFGKLSAFDNSMPASVPVKNLPPNFDEINFISSAKKFFVTMQGLFDKGDLAGLREYCTDEVVTHLKLEIQDRASAENTTDILTLNAQLIGFEVDQGEQIATVAFTGMLREERNAAANEINELWTMIRPLTGGGWVLAGIHNL
jgi:predicted lipid-binding transport protein (Tim44 family)